MLWPISLPKLRQQLNERSFGVLNRTQYPSDIIAVVVLRVCPIG